MASKNTAQRVFIWIIAGTMAIGSLGAYFLIILQNNNQQNEFAAQQEAIAKLSCEPAEAQPDRAFPKPDPIKFDKDSVTKLKTEDVTVGSGDEVVTDDACVTVHYIGNIASGEVFDESYTDGTARAFRLNQVIAGWQEGMQGMKEGGKRVIYIPSDQAYGETGSGEIIKPNDPLVFTVELIDIKE